MSVRPPRTTAPSPAFLVALAALLLCMALGTAAAAAPEAEPWPRWEQHRAGNRLHIDHGAWSEFLQRNVDAKHPSGIHRLDYGRVTPLDRRILAAYLAQQAALPISTYNRNEQKAYWINLYNALTVRVVLDHWPVKSIREIDISPGFFSDGPWGAKSIAVEGEALSLDDIEHRILRPIWRDPRVHYLLNCASLGCPNLAPYAYTVFNLERDLDGAARAYVNHPRGVRLEGDALIVSSIYVWYEADFVGDSGGESTGDAASRRAGVLEHLRRYAAPALAQRLAAWRGGYDSAYDWALNAP